MKSVIKGVVTAFSMYSGIPMPKVSWEEDTLKYTMVFFPLVGAAVGAAEWLWAYIAVYFGLSAVLYGAVAAVLPLVITGGIHLDGFIDTSDAISSHQDAEKRLEILKDPRIGAFGMISAAVYLLLYTAIAAEYLSRPRFLIIYALGFVLSRALCSLIVVAFKKARNTGLVYMFSDKAQKKTVTVWSVIIAAAAAALMLWAGALPGIICAAAVLLWLALFNSMAKKCFGGVSGDLCGMFVCVSEIVVLTCVMLCAKAV